MITQFLFCLSLLLLPQIGFGMENQPRMFGTAEQVWDKGIYANFKENMIGRGYKNPHNENDKGIEFSDLENKNIWFKQKVGPYFLQDIKDSFLQHFIVNKLADLEYEQLFAHKVDKKDPILGSDVQIVGLIKARRHVGEGTYTDNYFMVECVLRYNSPERAMEANDVASLEKITPMINWRELKPVQQVYSKAGKFLRFVTYTDIINEKYIFPYLFADTGHLVRANKRDLEDAKNEDSIITQQSYTVEEYFARHYPTSPNQLPNALMIRIKDKLADPRVQRNIAFTFFVLMCIRKFYR